MNENISRKKFIKDAAIMGGSFSVLSGLASCSQKEFSKDPDKPNVIMITADDLGWKDLSCYGNRYIDTPNIDRLSKEGVLFERAFVVTSSCAPSRASLITGQYPHTNGVNGLTHIYKTRSLSPFHYTLPEALSGAGYNTALMGKWHVSPYLPTSWYGYNERLSGMFPKDFWINDISKAVDYIKKNKNNRFYLELNFMQNHRDAYGEFSMDPDFPVDPEKIKIPEYWNLPQWEEIKEEVARFFSQTMKMDFFIGKVLDTLDQLNLTENTIVVFISDNGPPYPGNKMSLYDRGVATPLLVRWPKKVNAKQKRKPMIESIDIMPTILEAVGIEPGPSIEGRSFLPLITGNGDQYKEKENIFCEMTNHVEYIPTRSVRTDRYKYIRNYSNIAFGLDQNAHMPWAHRLVQREDQPWIKPRLMEELYDLKKDPKERKNLVYDESYGSVLKDMQKRLDDHMKESKDPYLGKPFTYDYDPSRYVKRKAGLKYK